MYQIEFRKPIKYISDEQIYDNEPNENDFYEYDYLKINPTLHEEDSETKFQIIKKSIEFIPPSLKIQTIADIGCGSCAVLTKTLDYLHQKINKNISAVGIDISFHILLKSEKHSHLIKLRTNCEDDIPLKDNSISLSICLDILEHVHEPSSVLKEVSRISQFAIFKVPLELSLFTTIKGHKKRLRKLERKYGHIQHFNRSSILKLLGNNFKILHERYTKIPNRTFFVDKLQDMIIDLGFHKLFAVVFGGFIIVVAESIFSHSKLMHE